MDAMTPSEGSPTTTDGGGGDMINWKPLRD